MEEKNKINTGITLLNALLSKANQGDSKEKLYIFFPEFIYEGVEFSAKFPIFKEVETGKAILTSWLIYDFKSYSIETLEEKEILINTIDLDYTTDEYKKTIENFIDVLTIAKKVIANMKSNLEYDDLSKKLEAKVDIYDDNFLNIISDELYENVYLEYAEIIDDETEDVEEEAIEIEEEPELEDVEDDAIEIEEGSELEDVEDDAIEMEEGPELEDVEDDAIEIEEGPELEDIEEDVIEIEEEPELEDVEEVVIEIEEEPELEDVEDDAIEIEEGPELEDVEDDAIEMEEGSELEVVEDDAIEIEEEPELEVVEEESIEIEETELDKNKSSKDILNIFAINEIGKVLVSYKLCKSTEIKGIIINEKDKIISNKKQETINSPLKKSELLNKIKINLAGMAAEEILNDEYTNLNSSDLEIATSIAKDIVTKFGMSKLGLVYVKELNEYSSLKIYEEVNDILKDCYADSIEIIKKNKKEIKKLVDLLLDKKEISEQEIINTIK